MEWLQHLLEDSALKNKLRVLPLLSVLVLVLILALQAPPSRAQSESSLSQRIQKVISRPEFAHANFGIEFYSLDSGKVVYALNADKLFVPASTTKILTEGTLLAKLGADYRFHTRVYRTGPIDKHGTLKGDLVLVASGDPNGGLHAGNSVAAVCDRRRSSIVTLPPVIDRRLEIGHLCAAWRTPLLD